MEYYTFNDKTGKIIDHTGKCVNGLKEIQLSLFDFSSTGEYSRQIEEVFLKPIESTGTIPKKVVPVDDNLDDLYRKEYEDPETWERIREPYWNR